MGDLASKDLAARNVRPFPSVQNANVANEEINLICQRHSFASRGSIDDIQNPFSLIFVPGGFDYFMRELDVPVDVASVSGEIVVICFDVLGWRIIFGPIWARSK